MARLPTAVKILCLVVCVAALGACARLGFKPRESLPRPEAALTAPWTRLDTALLPAGSPVLVAPVQGLSDTVDGSAYRAAKAIADALVARDILATTRNAAATSYILETQVTQGVLAARLSAPNGMTVKTLTLPLKSGALDDAALSGIADDMAGALLGTGAAVAAADTGGPKLRIVSVEGAPGDGNRALALALGYDLEKRGFRIVDTSAEGTLEVRAKVALERRDTRDHVTLVWQVKPAGVETVATIRQENDVPAGALDAKWGLIATAAAAGGADGIVEAAGMLLRQQGR